MFTKIFNRNFFGKKMRFIHTCIVNHDFKQRGNVPITHARDKLQRHKGGKAKKPALAESNALVPISPIHDPELDLIIDRSFRIRGMGHQVLVIQPYIKWGRHKNTKRTPQARLAEAVALVKSLKDWRVVAQATIGLANYSNRCFFGEGVVERLKKEIDGNTKITAVFVSHEMMRGHQQWNLEQELGVPVFDRYMVVIQIFREHAKSKEALLQIQLAEIPYLWSRLRGVDDGVLENFTGGEFLSHTPFLSVREEVLKAREVKIRKEIKKLREYRERIRDERKKYEYPTVAIVGYTNAGKTSLIKALTEKKSLTPQNYLFATLDVSAHQGYLPSGLDVLYIDTVGFISDIPTNLMEAFITTLEDAMIADIVVHVRDISHPDTEAQRTDVIETLNNLDLSIKVMENVITVGNKIDLLSMEDVKNFPKQEGEEDMIFVSADKNYGIDYLRFQIEEKILKVTNRSVVVMKVRTGSEEYFWLHDNMTVVDENPVSADSEFINVKVITTEVAFSKFKHYYITNYKKR